MGQAISNLIESFEQDAEKEKEASDALNAMIEMAKLQVSAFKLAISNPNFDAKLIPIAQIISSESIIQANITNTPADIGTVIKDTFSAFAKGSVADGIASLVNSGLTLLLGQYSANTSTRDTYLISTGDIGGVWRFDLHFFAYRYTSQQLKDIAKEVLAVSVVISSADLRNVTDNTLRVIVQQTYSTSSKEEQDKIYKDIKAAKDADTQPSRAQTSAELRRAIKKLKAGRPLSNIDHHHSEVSVEFEVETPINQAREQSSLLESWINGGIARVLHKQINGISVTCDQDEESTSNNRISGEATVTLTKHDPHFNPSSLGKVLHQCLKDASDTALSELDIISYRIHSTPVE